MEAEFVNEYINRLIANLHDVTSKNVMLEARLAIAEKVIANLNVELQQAIANQKKAKTESSPAASTS